jgi:hypothetical protein
MYGEKDMSDNATDAAPPARDMLEPSARALSEYIVRIAVLPFTLLGIKPRDMASLVETGAYRPLPPPFLLTFVTGVAVSGVASNLGVLFASVGSIADPDGAAEGAQSFVSAVMTSFGEADGAKAVLLAIPYIATIWIFSGIVSFFMGRGFRNVELIFAFLSFTIAAIVEIGMLTMIFLHYFGDGGDSSLTYAGIGSILLWLFVIIMLVKLFRYLMHVRAPSRWTWIGSLLGFAVAAFILLFVALVAFVPAAMILDNKMAAAELTALP